MVSIKSIKWTILSFVAVLSLGFAALHQESNILAWATIAVLILSPLVANGEYRRLKEEVEQDADSQIHIR